jgi:hypothetical protein
MHHRCVDLTKASECVAGGTPRNLECVARYVVCCVRWSSCLNGHTAVADGGGRGGAEALLRGGISLRGLYCAGYLSGHGGKGHGTNVIRRVRHPYRVQSYFT